MATLDLIPFSQLRALLAGRDVHLSESQLKRLRANGLLACEQQIHVAGELGSSSLYPSWSVGQVELVERLSRRERRFRQLRVLARWHDGWAAPDKLRDSLVEMVDGFSTKIRELADGPGDELAAVDRVTSALVSKPGRSRAQRLLRRRLKGQNLDRIAFALVALGLGTEIEWENHDPTAEEPSLRSVFERAVGIERARVDSVAGEPTLLMPETSTESLLSEIQATGSFEMRDAARVFNEADDAMIDQGFADAQVLASLAPIAQAAQIIHGDDIAGLASLEVLIDDDFDAVGITLLVRQAILLRRWVSVEAWESLKESVERESPKAITLVELHRAFPEYSALLTGDSEAKLDALPPVEREEVHARIRSFFAQRPELAGELTDEAAFDMAICGRERIVA